MSEKLARRFHELYEELAPVFGYKTRKDTKLFDKESDNGRLMIAVTDIIEKDFEKNVYDMRVYIDFLEQKVARLEDVERNKNGKS